MKAISTCFMLLVLCSSIPAIAIDLDRTLLMIPAPGPGDLALDLNARRPLDGARWDTTWFGGYQILEGEYHALSSPSREAVVWTFDRNIGPFGDPDRIENGEGWKAVDLTVDPLIYFRVIDGTFDLGPGVPPPILSGERSFWVGASAPEAGALCWPCGAGYGNDWAQCVVSPPLAYNGDGTVTLRFTYFQDSERCFDGTQVYLRLADGVDLLLNPHPLEDCEGQSDWAGGFTGAIPPSIFTRQIGADEIGVAQEIRFVFEFTSDGGWSDEDCEYETVAGPFGADDVAISGGGIDLTYDFEDGLQGWIPGAPITRTYAGIADVGIYPVLDPCACRLSGNLIEMHDGIGEDGFHPDGQYEMIESPICDLGSPEPRDVFMELDLYAATPPEVATLFSPAWKYYPWQCEVTGEIGWSPMVTDTNVWYYWPDPTCGRYRFSANQNGVVPPTAEKVIAIIQLLADCSAFTLPPPCETNFSPIFDNIVVGATRAPAGPSVNLDIGMRFQDVGSQLDGDPNGSALFSVKVPGPANVCRDIYFDNTSKPDRCGDSLVVVGPLPTADPNTRWDAKLWWRVARRAVWQAERYGGSQTRYSIWKARVADGKAIDRAYRPEFTWGWMDSVQAGANTLRNRFLTSFREDDDDFVGEGNPENEMLWDELFFPGTRIEYFITASYRNQPGEMRFLPDTTGGMFFEFEILPGVRVANVDNCAGSGFDFCAFHPATLYIDADNARAQVFIENALAFVLNGMPPCLDPDGCPIPRDRNWDRYDYLDANSNWKAPFARGLLPGSNNGLTLNQIVGYRTILLNTGSLGAGAMEDIDFRLFDGWLHSSLCITNMDRQVFMASGDGIGEILEYPGWGNGSGAAFLHDVLGASLYCDAFNGRSSNPDCGEEDDSFCVQLPPVAGAPFQPESPVDAWGNGICTYDHRFDVFGATGSGIGTATYSSEEGAKEMAFSRVIREDLAGNANFRSVIDGVSWDHMALRDPGGSGEGLCPRDLPSIVGGIIAQVAPALRWGFGVATNTGIPKLTDVETLAICQGTWTFPASVEEEASPLVDRLYGSEPNPFNPRTTIRFSLARQGRVSLKLYDSSGRIVRNLVDEAREAGRHTVVWDGTNDSGHRVGSGVYWVQMESGRFTSNRKLILVK